MHKLDKHIFLCGNQRPPDAPKKSCGNHGGNEFREILKSKITGLGLNQKIRVNKAGCLGKCGYGPVMVIYPQGIWYGGVQESDLDEILEKSILDNNIIERLVIKGSNEKTKASSSS